MQSSTLGRINPCSRCRIWQVMYQLCTKFGLFLGNQLNMTAVQVGALLMRADWEKKLFPSTQHLWGSTALHFGAPHVKERSLNIRVKRRWYRLEHILGICWEIWFCLHWRRTGESEQEENLITVFYMGAYGEDETTFSPTHKAKWQEAANISIATMTIPTRHKRRIFSNGQEPKDDFWNMTQQNTVQQLCWHWS